MSLDMFEKYIILVNFSHYVEVFAEKFNAEIYGKGLSMQCASAEQITIINFGMGSANAATIMDLLMAIKPKACLFLGKCGGLKLKKNKVGDLILPIAAIRGGGNVKRLISYRSTGASFLCLAKSDFHHDKRLLQRLLDRDCIYHQQKGMGI